MVYLSVGIGLPTTSNAVRAPRTKWQMWNSTISGVGFGGGMMCFASWAHSSSCNSTSWSSSRNSGIKFKISSSSSCLPSTSYWLQPSDSSSNKPYWSSTGPCLFFLIGTYRSVPGPAKGRIQTGNLYTPFLKKILVDRPDSNLMCGRTLFRTISFPASIIRPTDSNGFDTSVTVRDPFKTSPHWTAICTSLRPSFRISLPSAILNDE